MASAADIEALISALPGGSSLVKFVNAKLDSFKTMIQDEAEKGVDAWVAKHQGYIIGAAGALGLALLLSIRANLKLNRMPQRSLSGSGIGSRRRLPPPRKPRR